MNILKVLTAKRAVGNYGEKAAAKFLKKNGYRILERNYVAEGAEIDIIASKKNLICFVEVKARSQKSIGGFEARPAASVTKEKQRKIIKAASHYIRFGKQEKRLRFDIIEVYLEDDNGKTRLKEIRHLENTFDLDTARKRYY